jgi:hypothetical protein
MRRGGSVLVGLFRPFQRLPRIVTHPMTARVTRAGGHRKVIPDGNVIKRLAVMSDATIDAWILAAVATRVGRAD